MREDSITKAKRTGQVEDGGAGGNILDIQASPSFSCTGVQQVAQAEEPFAIATECQFLNGIAVTSKGPEDFPGLHIPEMDHLINPSRCQKLPIRAEGQTADAPGVPAECPDDPQITFVNGMGGLTTKTQEQQKCRITHNPFSIRSF